MAVTQQNKHKRGFTLLEIIIVVSMLGLLMPAIFSILYAILQQQLKVYRITETKRQGDLVLEFMKEKISRDAVRIHNNGGVFLCENAGDTSTTANGNIFRFTDDNGNNFWFNQQGNGIRYRDVGVDTTLNSVQVRATNFEIGCIRRGTNTLVQFSYTMNFFDPTPTAEEGTVSLNYVTKIRLR